MVRRFWWFWGVPWLVLACNGVPSPEPPPPTTTSTTTTSIPVATAPFTWHLARVFSLFSGTDATLEEVQEVFGRYKSEWTNLWPTARVCAERQSWSGDRPWLPRGPSAVPFDETAPAFEATERFLTFAASVPHAQVLLVPICNLKEDGTTPVERESWVRNICRLSTKFENVAIEVVNEWKHPNSTITEEEIFNLVRACKAEAPGKQIGSDARASPSNSRYPEFLRAEVTFFSWHPWRNPNPDEDQIREMVRQCIGCAVLSETTAYDGGGIALGGLVTQSKEDILLYLSDTERKGGVFAYHSLWGLGWPHVERFPEGYEMWIPPRGTHAIKHGL